MSAIRGITGIEGPFEAKPIGGVSSPSTAGGVGLSTEAGGALAPTSPVEGAQGVSFSDVLGNLVGTSAARGHEAAHKAEALASGAEDDVHGTMIAAKEAEISLKLVGTIRTKLVEAFHELWRTSV
jgi:flagellar hook-basal body complex protein FliE